VNSAEQDIYVWIGGDSETAFKRLIGCALVAMMPDQGIDEAVDALKDIWDFNQPVAPVLPEPAPIRQGSGYVTRIIDPDTLDLDG
jgi:hypothetical protein